MFYCNDCAEKFEYPESIGKSVGICECCGNKSVCNDRPSSSLPLPKKQNLNVDGCIIEKRKLKDYKKRE